jgi:hypothetical protein
MAWALASSRLPQLDWKAAPWRAIGPLVVTVALVEAGFRPGQGVEAVQAMAEG